jgi:hypothetical protein
MNALGVSILVILIVVVLGASRRVALLGMMAGVLYLTEGQQVQVLGLNLFAGRFLELAGFIRVMSRREFSFSNLNKIDLALIWLYGFTTIVFVLRSPDGQAYAIGMAGDAFLSYFTFRGLIGNMEDFRWFLRTFLLLLVPYTLAILYESFSRHDLFSSMGGVAEGTWVRGDRVRCFGSFRQPDLLGMFAASFLPLYIALSCIARERKFAIIAICLCLIIVWASNSGGPASAVGMGLLGWMFWRVRTEMRKVRWGIVCVIVLLALVMKAPIWYIFAHISSVTGGDGYHRSYLLDMACQHFDHWWLDGMPIKDTSDWFPYELGDTGQADITNQYVAFGLNAGVGAIVLFILLLKRAYGAVGQALTVIRSSSTGIGEAEFLFWGLGIMLAVHITNWFGITYFDQTYMLWFMQLAVISTLFEQYQQMPEKMTGDAVETGVDAEIRHGDCFQSS